MSCKTDTCFLPARVLWQGLSEDYLAHSGLPYTVVRPAGSLHDKPLEQETPMPKVCVCLCALVRMYLRRCVCVSMGVSMCACVLAYAYG